MRWTNVLRQLFKIQSYSVGVSNALLLLDCILADTSTTWDVFQVKFFGTLMLPILFIPIGYVIVKYVLHGGWDEFVASLILFWYLMYSQIVKSVTALFACSSVNPCRSIDLFLNDILFSFSRSLLGSFSLLSIKCSQSSLSFFGMFLVNYVKVFTNCQLGFTEVVSLENTQVS